MRCTLSCLHSELGRCKSFLTWKQRKPWLVQRSTWLMNPLGAVRPAVDVDVDVDVDVFGWQGTRVACTPISLLKPM